MLSRVTLDDKTAAELWATAKLLELTPEETILWLTQEFNTLPIARQDRRRRSYTVDSTG